MIVSHKQTGKRFRVHGWVGTSFAYAICTSLDDEAEGKAHLQQLAVSSLMILCPPGEHRLVKFTKRERPPLVIEEPQDD
jgi:hypothetical protein